MLAQLSTESVELTETLAISNLHYITKPLIVISLLALLIYHTSLRGRFVKRIAAGLFFGLGGDVFLMFQHTNPNFFLLGLASFLIGHLLYISAFYLDYLTNPTIGKKYTKWAILVFGVFCMAFYILLREHLGAMKIPVLIYAFVISLMAIMAVNRHGRVNSFSFNLIFIGAVLFLLSDSILAYNKFVKPFTYAGIPIMATYMLAQFCITIGTIERKIKKKITESTI